MSPRGRRRSVEPPSVSREHLRSWFAGHLPDDWFEEPVEVRHDRDEILVSGRLPLPKIGEDDDPTVAARERISAFREATRTQRMAVAEQAQERFLRQVSWSASCGDEEIAFTTANVPVMTRLAFDERATLDTLIEAGVARSRSEALAWCVRLVAQHEADWIARLRDAMDDLREVRAERE